LKNEDLQLINILDKENQNQLLFKNSQFSSPFTVYYY